MIQANMGRKKPYPADKNGSFPCPFCPYASNSRSYFRAHVADIHDKFIGPLECCGISFSNRTALKHHTVTCHHPKYKCAVCDRRFFTAFLLKRHEIVHSDSKEFNCEFCDYATALKSNLKQHVERIHMNGPDEEWCETEVKKRHKCQVCHRKYQFKSRLRQHMLAHTDKKGYKCSICEYSTARKGHLKRHVKIHESKSESSSTIVPVKRSRNSTVMIFTDESDSHQEEDARAVKTILVDKRLCSSRRTTMSTENSESHVVEKKLSNRVIEEESEDQAPSDTPIDIVVDNEESCYPSSQMDAHDLESVDDMDIRHNATSSSFSVEHISSQRLSFNPSLPVLSDPIHEEARQLRSQIPLATTISAVLSILERLMELSASITNQIRFFGSVDFELRSKAVELFEYVWSISKMAVCRWEDMEGSMSRNNFLRAVQYAYETLPVFFNLEFYEHFEMMEHIVLLILNTVKNCRRPSSIGSTVVGGIEGLVT